MEVIQKYKKIISNISYLLFLILFLLCVIVRYINSYWFDLLFVPLILSLMFLFVAIAFSYSDIIRFIKNKNSKAIISIISNCIMLIGSLVLLNLIVLKYDTTWDLSVNKTNTLSDFSKNTISQLKSKLEIMAFIPANQSEIKNRVEFLLDLYVGVSDKISYQIIEPKMRPDLLQENQIEANDKATLVLQYDGKKTKIKESDVSLQLGSSLINEESLSNQIYKISKEKNKKIYFLEGHGERDTQTQNPESISKFVQSLKDLGYDIRSLRLLEFDKVPGLADLLVIAGPERALIQSEVLKIKRYLESGGNLLVLADPGKQHNLAQISKLVGIEFQNNFIIDIQGQKLANSAVLSVGTQYNMQHDISKSIPLSEYTLFSFASSLQKAPDAPVYYKINTLVKSAEESFTQNNLQVQAIYNPNTDRKGPLDLIIASEGDMYTLKNQNNIEAGVEKNQFKAVVAGDSDFVSNQFLSQVYNKDLALNIVSYLVGDFTQISIRPKDIKNEALYWSDTYKSIYVLLQIGFSLIFFLLAIWIWFKRRS